MALSPKNISAKSMYMVSRALQLMNGRDQHDLVAVALVLERPGSHYGRHRAAEAEQHGNEGLAGEAQRGS